MTTGAAPGLTGQVAIVTGGENGIGRATALRLAAVGMTVIVVDRSIGDTVPTIEAAGGRALAKTLDVTDQPAVDQMVREVEQQFGAVDLLVNNAGIGAPSLGLVWEIDPDWWWRTLDVNLHGQFLCARAVLPAMVRRRQGRIVNLSSGMAESDAAGCTAYSASKGGIAIFTRCLATETRDYGIATFAISPGFVRTPMNEAIGASPVGLEIIKAVADMLANGKDDPPEICTHLILQLASGKADALSGHFIDAVEDDLNELIRRADEIQRDGLYALHRTTFKAESTSQ